MYDIIIIGCGPAGMTAAIYGRLANKKVLVLEKEAYGGQILKANKIKNYPGFEEISGFEFSTKLYNQIKNLNADIKFEEVIEIKNNDIKEVITKKNTYQTKTIIIAAGSKNKELGLVGENKFKGKGISYCATCDGNFYKDKIVAVNGGGNSAIEDALYLSNLCKKVYLIYRQKEFKIDSMSLTTLKEKENVEFILNTNINSINGNEKLENITIINNNTKEETKLDIDGLFIAIGHIPVSSICSDLINIDSSGYIEASETCKTNIDGIFVAGDIRKKNVKQLTTACSDGTVAALTACKYLIENNK